MNCRPTQTIVLEDGVLNGWPNEDDEELDDELAARRWLVAQAESVFAERDL